MYVCNKIFLLPPGKEIWRRTWMYISLLGSHDKLPRVSAIWIVESYRQIDSDPL
jgi:hypothetical protein